MKIRKLEIRVRKHFLIIIFAVLVTAALILQGIYDWHSFRRNNSELDGQAMITNLIDSATDGLVSQAPVDASTGDVYFPHFKLMLPASDSLSLNDLEYSDLSHDSNLDLQVTSKSILDQSKEKLAIAQINAESKHENSGDVLMAIFHQVPNLQACVRGVQLFYSPQQQSPSGLQLQFTKKLHSGKTIYAYNESVCRAYGMSDLVGYLKQIQSY